MIFSNQTKISKLRYFSSSDNSKTVQNGATQTDRAMTNWQIYRMVLIARTCNFWVESVQWGLLQNLTLMTFLLYCPFLEHAICLLSCSFVTLLYCYCFSNEINGDIIELCRRQFPWTTFKVISSIFICNNVHVCTVQMKGTADDTINVTNW